MRRDTRDKPLHVALAVGPDSEHEANAIRFTLEDFGARVTGIWIGLPKYVLDLFSTDIPKNVQHLLLAFHGHGGRLVNTACSMASESAAKAFLQAGAKAYLASRGYIEGNASLLFIASFYYQLLQHRAPLTEAHRIAAATGAGTARYKLYEAQN